MKFVEGMEDWDPGEESTIVIGGLWISPDWEVFDVGYWSHEKFAKDYIGEDYPTSSGWIYVGWDEDNITVDGYLDESKFKKVVRNIKEFIGDDIYYRVWNVRTGSGPELSASPEDIEEYGSIWLALVRGRQIRGSLQVLPAIVYNGEIYSGESNHYDLVDIKVIPAYLRNIGRPRDSVSREEWDDILLDILGDEESVPMEFGFLIGKKFFNRKEISDVLGEFAAAEKMGPSMKDLLEERMLGSGLLRQAIIRFANKILMEE